MEENQVQQPNNEEEGISYKINTKFSYKVNRSEYEGRVYYTINIFDKTYKGEKIMTDRRIKFRKEVDLADGTYIRIKKGFEGFFPHKNNKYIGVPYYFVLDFEISENNRELNDNLAVNDYLVQAEQANYEEPMF